LTTIADKTPNAYGAILATISGPESFRLPWGTQKALENVIASVLQSDRT